MRRNLVLMAMLAAASALFLGARLPAKERAALVRKLAARRDTRVLSAWDAGEAGTALRPSKTEAMLIAGESAVNPGDHSVIEGTAPAGRVLRLRKDFKTPSWGEPFCRNEIPLLLLFRALRDRLGFSNLTSAATGGAALGPDTFRFSRQWMRDQFARLNDPREPGYTLSLKLNLPPSYLLIHRVWLGGIGVLCQIGGEIPVLDVLDAYVSRLPVPRPAHRSGQTPARA